MYSVLIMDDERIMRMGMRSIIERGETRFGEIYECANGLEALEFLEGHAVDLIITDIKMPKMDGLAFLEELTRRYGEKVPQVIIFSGHKDFQYARQALRYSVCDYLLKPVGRRELLSCVLEVEERLRRTRAEDNGENKPSLARAGVETANEEDIPTADGALVVRLSSKWAAVHPEAIEQLCAVAEDFWRERIERGQAVLAFESQTQFVVCGQIGGAVGDFVAAMRQTGLVGLKLGLARAGGEGDERAALVENARQALKLARLDPQEALMTYRAEIDYSDDGKLMRALHYINDHYNENIGLADVAGQVEMNYSYASEFFKRCMGVGYSAYLTALRVQNAKTLLASKQYTIAEVGAMVGYTDPKRFAKTFHRCEGLSPMDYRKAVQKMNRQA